MRQDTEQILYNNKNIKKTLVFDGIIVGIGAGTVAVAYRWFLTLMEKTCLYMYSQPLTFGYLLSIILGLGLFGIIIGRLVKYAPLSSGSGIPQIEGELMGVFNMDEKKTIVAKFVGGSLAAAGGLSLGREGPSIQLGGAMGKLVAKFLRRDINEQRYLISAGASAGLSAAFSAPISGTIFILEEVYKNFSPLVVVPAIIASVIADFISKNIFGMRPSFSFSVENSLSLYDYGHIVALGIFVGVVGVFFNRTLLFIQTLYKKLKIKNEFKPIIPFMFAILFAFTFPYVLGGGHSVIERLVENRVSVTTLVMILLLNTLFTSISYGSTAQGGIFLPTLVIGAVTGGVYYNLATEFNFLISQDYFVNFIVLAMSGMLASVVRSPILAIMLVVEMTGSFEHVLSLAVVAIVAYLVAEILRCKPIYESLLERMLENNELVSGDYDDEKVIYHSIVSYNSFMVDKTLKEIKLPWNALIVSIKRLHGEIVPNGETVIKAGDNLTILTDNKNLKDVAEFVNKD